jgi:phosphoglycolate phosphatase-like HAD superfamily hydrolase
MPHLEEFLRAVGELGIRKAIVTLLSGGATSIVLGLHGIQADVVVARESRLRPKPYPDQVIEALRKLGIKSHHAVMIGDSEWDEEAASAAGVCFIAITNGRVNHGFRRPVIIVNDLGEASRLIPGIVGAQGSC